ncbi:DUF262 domain-containing protein [Buttiauxella sp. S04-F03]|uniref:DUF262 domain-containing protein n=1 Tax=Buttiauxella sp. W03-F01 TaxID=2904524 RepID=UPI001E40A38D|nr:DUF262 domain-containing protein [Buttiauxella sp. W03-F01]MCE0799583.1 DUF262 domain-containing protein [Buttiauxella sp. W03-F01]
MVTLKHNLDELQQIAKERTVKTQTIEYDLETLVKKIQKNVIKLNPEYQRKHRWSDANSSRLIESLILNIPIPFIYISQDVDVDEEVDTESSRFSVIDGQQRLTAIFNFFQNEYQLEGLEVLDKLNGSYYKDLPSFLIRRLEERSIRCLRIDSTVDPQVKYDIFERLNSGSVKLESQELRNATCRGPFKDLVKKLVCNQDFLTACKLTPNSKRVKKMEDEELILRFFAINYKNGYSDYKGGFKQFLTNKMSEFNELDEKSLKGMEKDFVQTFRSIATTDLQYPFAKYRITTKGLKKMSDFNASVFDAVTHLFMLRNKKGEQLDSNTVINMFTDPDFFTACEGSVNDVSKLNFRIEKARGLV